MRISVIINQTLSGLHATRSSDKRFVSLSYAIPERFGVLLSTTDASETGHFLGLIPSLDRSLKQASFHGGGFQTVVHPAAELDGLDRTGAQDVITRNRPWYGSSSQSQNKDHLHILGPVGSVKALTAWVEPVAAFRRFVYDEKRREQGVKRIKVEERYSFTLYDFTARADLGQWGFAHSFRAKARNGSYAIPMVTSSSQVVPLSVQAAAESDNRQALSPHFERRLSRPDDWIFPQVPDQQEGGWAAFGVASNTSVD